jgi:hypothetical protein
MEGYQEPTYSWVPEGECDRLLLEMAIEFNDMIGLPPLAPWQILVLGDWLAGTDDGWLATEWTLIMPRQNGKTHLVILRVLFGLLVLKERHIVFTTHNFGVTRAIMDDLRKIISSSEALTKALVFKLRNGFEQITTRDGRGVIRFKARTKHGPRGLSRVDLIVYDEAFLLDYETLEGFGYTQAAANNPQALFLSSAGTELSTFLKDKRRAGHEGGSTTSGYHEWCAEEGDDYANPAIWLKANPGVGWAMKFRRIAQEWETGRRNPKSFARERLGVWPTFSTVGKAINLESYQECVLDTPVLPTTRDLVTFGLDVEYDRSAASLACAWRADGVDHVAIVRFTPKVDEIIAALPDILSKVGRERSIHMRPSRDVRETYDSLLSNSVLRFQPKQDVFQLTWPEYASACQGISSSFSKRDIRVIQSASLDAAVLDAIPKIDRDGGWVFHRDKESAPNSSLVAAAMALWALRQKLVGAPPPPAIW